MKQIFLVFLFTATHIATEAQMKITTGAALVASGTPGIVLNNLDLVNNGSFIPGNSNVSFTGNAAGIDISGTTTTPFYNLTVNRSGDNLTLLTGFQVLSNLNMISGNLDLNGNNISLDGTILGEGPASYITGPAGGLIIKTVNLNAPVSQNPGNLGFQITSAANLGSTTISRGHVQQTSPTGFGINRFYDVVPSNNSGLNATVLFRYLDNELAGITESELKLWASPNMGATWDLLGSDAINTTTNFLTKNSVNTLSRFTLGSSISNPLPVGLLSFSATLVNRQTQLRWVMENETGIAYYEVERSADAQFFSKLDKVNAKGAATEAGYDLIDPVPFNGYTYYRLKIFNKANEFHYSGTVKVYLPGEAEVIVYPNPATDKLYIEFVSADSRKLTLKLTDALGKLVGTKDFECQKGNNKIEWSLDNYAAAVYYLHLNGINNSVIRLTKL